MKLYQQGDVLIEEVTELKGKKVNHKILAVGEVTGHSHTIVEDDVELWEDNGVLFINAPTEFTVTHQEHKPVTIPKGKYKVRKVLEYDHFLQESRNVRD